METSSEEHYHSSCNPLFEQVLKPFLKCLGYEEATNPRAPMHQQEEEEEGEAMNPPPPHPQAENQMKSKEDEVRSTVRRKPTKPKIGSGGGPKINSSSSS